jgi:hypothetical protein
MSRPFPAPGAEFFSWLAYPKASDEALRNRFWTALCRWAIMERCETDHVWAQQAQPIIPLFFLPLKPDLQAIGLGRARLDYRFKAAFYLALPNFGDPTNILDGFTPTMRNLRDLAMNDMGWTGSSDATFSSRIWATSRPVIHAALACVIVRIEFSNKCVRGVMQKGGSIVSPPVPDPLLDCIISNTVLEKICRLSEGLRFELPKVEELKIKEHELARFLIT